MAFDGVYCEPTALVRISINFDYLSTVVILLRLTSGNLLIVHPSIWELLQI